MFNDLPDSLKNRVHELLKANDFPTAKALHDNWMAEKQNQLSHAQCSVHLTPVA